MTSSTNNSNSSTNNNSNSTNSSTNSSSNESVTVFSTPTMEMKVVWSLAHKYLYPSRQNFLSKFIQYLTVTPLAHVSNASFEFQLYLYYVFHTTKLARVVHTFCLPLMTLACMMCFVQLKFILFRDPRLAYNNPTPGNDLLLLEWNGAYFIAFLLSLWYSLTAFVNKLPILVYTMVPFSFALAHAATWIQALTAYPPAESTWYASAPWMFNPLLWIPFFSLMLTFSHLGEPFIPPPFSGTNHWISTKQYYLGPDSRPYTRMEIAWKLIKTLPFFGSAISDEFWAGWRLLPIAVLEICGLFGYVPDISVRAKLYAERAIAAGDPALNFIGVGGYAPLPEKLEKFE